MAGRTVLDVRPLTTESRNTLWRVTLDAGERAVLKVYDPASDPHAANRFRREEKVLTLLGSTRPPVAPRVIAGFIGASTPPMLLMEDVGERSLADDLGSASPAAAAARWAESIDFLYRLHSEMERRRQPLYRTTMAISLDRITGPVLVSRFRIAGERLAGMEAPAGALREYRALMTPALAAPKAMIHNSMSPLNIVPGPGGWRAVDWETIAVASPLWDWVDLLRAPYNPLPFDDCEAIAMRATRSAAGLFHRAVLSRCLDGLATVMLRLRHFRDEGREERATEYARRAACYAGDVRCAAVRLGVSGALADWLEKLTGGEE
jgi:hypothetical protein